MNSNINSFDFVRFIAAVLVMFSHSFVLAGVHSYVEPMIYLSNGKVDLGKIAVVIFFIISGFLIAGSWNRGPVLRNFIVSRILRIFPGLAVSLLFCIAVGAIITIDNDNFKISAVSFFLKNLFLYKGQVGLPGVFVDNSFGPAVNGSLWTLRHEFSCYIIVALVGYLGFLNKASAFIFWSLACVATMFFPVNSNFIREFLPLLVWFMAGVIVYFVRDLNITKINMVFIVVILFIFIFSGSSLVLISPILAWILIKAMYIPWAGVRFGKYGDFSYGMYIYAFPVQQFFSFKFPQQTYFGNFFLSFFTTLFLAMISWHVVEKSSLNLKKSFSVKS